MRTTLLTCCLITSGLLMAAPRFIGAEAYGVRPGHELIWRVPIYAAEKVEAVSLPEGIAFDAARRVLRGTIAEAGDYPVVLKAAGEGETVTRTLTLRVGEAICLAPPMGWNSWYSYSEAVSQEGIEKVARLLDSTGLADYGWSYVNIDDCWQGDRPAGKALRSNARFPDMKAMCETIHSLGLKAGIYTSPWVGTYAGFRGSSCDANVPVLAPEERLQPGQVFGRYPGLHRLKADRVGSIWMFDADAKQFAEWGFDYVKLDWKPNDVPTAEKMFRGLRESGRDIVMSLSNSAPLRNAPALSKIANLWRTTGDITDTWESVRAIGREQIKWITFRSEGHWNDPDILQIGCIGTPNRPNVTFRPSGLKQHEQHYQMALWCMLSSPLLISSDLENMAPETKALLTDPDMIELNQKYASAPLSVTEQNSRYFVLRKDVTASRSVYGLFNDSDAKQTIALPDGSRHEVAPHCAKLVSVSK